MGSAAAPPPASPRRGPGEENPDRGGWGVRELPEGVGSNRAGWLARGGRLPPVPDEASPSAADSIVLIQRYQAGDADALNLLFTRYYQRVRRLVRIQMGAWLKGREEVDDLVQETFASACKAFDRYEAREDGQLIYWFSKAASHQIINAVEHHRALRRDADRDIPMAELAPDATGTSADWSPTAQTTGVPDKASRNEETERLDACVRTLKDDYREVVLLRDYSGCSWNAVAEEMSLHAEAARALYGRARARLAVLMNR